MKIIPLSKVCSRIVDCPHETPEWKETGIPVIRNYNLVDGHIDTSNLSFVDEETYLKRVRREVPQKDDVIFSREAPIGNCGIIPNAFKCCLGQRLVLLRANQDICTPSYLITVLQSDYVRQQIEQVSKRGSIVSNFAIEDLKELLIPIIDNQDDVAHLYTLLSDKISNNTEITVLLEKQAKLLYDYWFVQFDFPDENGKPYKSSGGKMVWNEELKREIPDGWEVSTLKGKYDIKRGISYTSKDIESGDGTPMINLACIDIKRNYRDGEIKYYNGNVTPENLLSPNDLLIACTDLTRNADIVGSPILTPNDGNTYTFSMDIAKLIPNEAELNPIYLYMALRTEYYHKYIKRWASGTNVLHLDLTGLDWYKMWFPPKALQDRFADAIISFEERKHKTMVENQELASLRDFLLPMLMNGQVKVKKEDDNE